MDLAYTPEEQAFREKVRAWINQHLDPALAAKVRNGLRLERDDIQGLGQDPGQEGLAGLWLAPGISGPGWGAVPKHLFAEELARAAPRRILPFGPVMVALVIMAYGTPEQQEAFRPASPAARSGGARAIPSRAPAPTWPGLKTRAERHGDHYLVNGQKTWTTLGQHGDWIFNLVRAPDEGKPGYRHQLPADRHEEPRRDRAPDQAAGRGVRGQRGVLRECEGAC